MELTKEDALRMAGFKVSNPPTSEDYVNAIDLSYGTTYAYQVQNECGTDAGYWDYGHMAIFSTPEHAQKWIADIAELSVNEDCDLWTIHTINLQGGVTL